jgi:TolB-like protein
LSEVNRHFRLRWALGLLFVLTAFFRSGTAVAEQRVAVLEMRGEVDSASLYELSEALRSGVESGLSRSAVTVVDMAQTQAASAMCTVDGCELDVGQMLGVDYVISGSLFSFEGRTICTLNVYDIGAGQKLVTEKILDSDLSALSGKISKTVKTIAAGVFKVQAIASEAEAVVEQVTGADASGAMATAARLAKRMGSRSGGGGDVVVTTPEFTDNGWFVTPRFGMSMVHGKYSSFLESGSTARLEAGRSVDGLGYGIFVQGTMYNGTHFMEQAEAGCFTQGTCVQGDTRVLKMGGLARYTVVDQAVRVIAQGAGGVATMPLLMDEKYFQEDVVNEAWQGNRPAVHDELHYFTNVGILVEYPMEGTGVAPQLAVETSYITGFGLGTEILLGFNAPF